MALLEKIRKNVSGTFNGKGMALGAALMTAASAPAFAQDANVQLAANNTASTTEIALTTPASTPYTQGQRVAQSEVKAALQYYDAIIYYGDDIRPISAQSNAELLTEDGIRTLALSGWSQNKCAIVLTANTNPGIESTFTQDDMDRGWLRGYAEDLIKRGKPRIPGDCLALHPPAS